MAYASLFNLPLYPPFLFLFQQLIYNRINKTPDTWKNKK